MLAAYLDRGEIPAIDAVIAPDKRLPKNKPYPRPFAVITLFRQGKLPAEIAKELNIPEHLVKAILSKLNGNP